MSCSPTLVGPDAPYPVRTAVDVALLSRYYERFGDHAVSAAQRVIILVTGERAPGGRPSSAAARR